MSTGSLITLFICNLIVPLTMFLFGLRMRRRPPKEIGGTFGYRTRRSMINAETWRFAHEKCGKIWTWTGLVLLLVSVGLSVFSWLKGGESLTRFVTSFSMGQVIVLLASVIPVERSLKKHFDENGNPKE